MEYCPLGDLSQCFQDPLSEEVVRSMCYQLLEGLVKLHDMKITHRDIKPQVGTPDCPQFRICISSLTKYVLEYPCGGQGPNLGENRRFWNQQAS